MKLKANLHLHAGDDQEDAIPYSFIEALDEAKRLGFTCLALTCHNTFVNKAEYAKAAEGRGILFVPGIERTIEKKHVIILNPDENILHVRTFEELAAYKKTRPNILIIAPHPFLGGESSFSLNGKLAEHSALFDAIEQTWFYSTLMNPNKKAARAAQEYSLPLIATSDTHELKWLNTSYAEIDVKEQSIPALFDAIRAHQFKNVSSPRSFFFEMAPYALHHIIVYILYLLKR